VFRGEHRIVNLHPLPGSADHPRRLVAIAIDVPQDPAASTNHHVKALASTEDG
jgi:hypothetical protein